MGSRRRRGRQAPCGQEANTASLGTRTSYWPPGASLLCTGCRLRPSGRLKAPALCSCAPHLLLSNPCDPALHPATCRPTPVPRPRPQVLSDPSTGRITALHADMAFDSDSLRAVVRGSGPVGSFTASIAGISMRGEGRGPGGCG